MGSLEQESHNTDYLSYYFVTSKAYAQKGKPITLGTSVSISL